MPPARAPDPADATIVPAAPSAVAGDPVRPVPNDGGPVSVVVAGYEVVEELGRGGMGVVYRARQVSLNRPVALKMILAGYQAGPRDRARFRAEAAAVARVQHPHIVQVFEVGEEAGRPYLALELVDGTTLQQKLAGAPQPPGPAAHLVELLARAVHHAHLCGVVHRDLKPGNVLLAAPSAGHGEADEGKAAALYGVPKITDFGLAKRIGDDAGQTRSGDLLGTPSYMAPEQAAGKAGGVGPAADVYALGAILYEMLTGRPPFRGATPLETLHQVLHDDPVHPGRLRPKLPRDLERICLKCLEKDPRKRYASAQDLADDLRRHLAGESVQARPAPVPERAWRWCRRNPVAAGLLAAATVGSVSGLLYLSWLTRSVVESTALQGAAQQSETLDEVNRYYGLVAQHAGGEKLGHGWENTPRALPFPATLTIELGERITARSDTGTKVRLYSDYPFKNRTDGGPRDDFERAALARLREAPDEPFFRFEDTGGQQVLRYATARRMTAAACVDCHNTLADSPKRDWQLGDVRGVLEVIRPLDRDQERVSRRLRGTALLIAGIGIVAVLLSAVTLVIGNRPRRTQPPDTPPAPDPDGDGLTPLPGGPALTHTPRGGPPMPAPRDPNPVDATLVPSPSSEPESAPDAEGTLLGSTTDGTGHADVTLAPPARSTPTPAAEATAAPETTAADATLVRPAGPPSSPPGSGTVAGITDVTLAPPAWSAPAPAAEATAVPETTAADATLIPSAGPPSSPPRTGTVGGYDRDPSATEADATRAPAAGPMSEVDVTRTFPSAGPTPTRPDASGPSAAPTGRPSGAAASGVVGAAVDRYVLRALHARGGLGEVFTARDTELNREVALKRIQARYADDPSSRRRFLVEAELTARLDHPGVVPVFGLVADGRGRPCYAMRFIRGESLRDEIDRFHQRAGTGATQQGTRTTERTAPYSGDESAGKGSAAPPPAPPLAPDARRIAFRQLLQRFIAVCQAIAYAHTRKVIHRDIKPANVMVGTFGETLVVDWGLAKALDDVPNADAIEQAAERAGFRRDPNATAVPDDHTAVGTAVGTPAYMSPEQAFGHVDQIGPASDIYSLGATLYCILTGRAPFGGSAPTETIKQVQQGAFSAPRELNPDAPPPLDAVCRRAMAVRPADRYATALDLAADVERWLSDEPVSCYRDPLPARFARWARRNPARVAGTLSLLGTGLVATAAILFVVDRARTETQAALVDATNARNDTQHALAAETAAKGELAVALTAVTAQRNETEKARLAADDARKLAQGRFALARAAFQTVVLEIQAQLEDRAGTQKFRQELLRTARQGLQKLIETTEHTSAADRREADHLLIWARLQMGDVYRSLGDTPAALNEYTTAVGKAEALLAETPGSVEVRRDLAAGYDRLAEIDLQAGKTAAAFDAAQKALAVRERLAEAAPGDPPAKRDLAASRDRLAVVELDRGHTREARAACAASLAARKELLAADPKEVTLAADLAQSHERDAEILLRTGDTTGAAKAATAAVDLRAEAAKARPESVGARRELARAYSRLGEVNLARAETAAALAAYRAGETVLGTVLAHDPLNAGAKLDAAVVHGRIGFVLIRTGDVAGALAEARVSRKLCQELVDTDPESARARRALADGHEYLGDALLANGQAAEAIEEDEKAREILQKLAQDDPGSVRALADLAGALGRAGAARLAAGQLTRAMDALVAGAMIRDHLAGPEVWQGRAFPAPARARREQGAAQDRLCEAHLRIGNHVQARVAAYKAFAVFRDLAEQDPGSGEAKRDLATAYAKWGEVALAQGDLTAAMILWHKSLAGFDAVAAVDATNAQAQEDRAAALERLGTINGATGNPDARLDAERKALAIREKLADEHPTSLVANRGVMTAQRRVGDALVELRRFREAREEYKDARAVASKFAGDSLFAAVFGAELGTVTDRLALIEAIQAGTRNPAALGEFPPDVRARALAALVSVHLRLHEPTSASRAAELLGLNARGPDDLYEAARGFVSAAAEATTEDVKAIYTRAAIEWLGRAADAGYRNADELAGRVWDAARDEEGFRAAERRIKAYPPLAPAPRAR